MIKIFLSVRNRLAITKKCIYALKTHSRIPHQIFVYNNNTTYLLEEHFKYFYKVFAKGFISQATFSSEDATFNAFSKASTSNFFGKQHELDPKKDSYDFLVMLDNDIIVTPDWDLNLLKAWKHVKKTNLNNVKVIGQLPGGIKGAKTEVKIDEKITGRIGKLGGSGLWSVRPNFFQDVGFLQLHLLVGHHKQHDQQYWQLLDRSSQGKPYIMGIDQKLGIHCGMQAGSVCNTLTRNRINKNKEKLINFEAAEEKISSMDFDTFYESIYNNKQLLKNW